MLNLTKVISSSVESGKRLVKFLRLGKDDVQEKNVIQPFGIDSVPPKDIVALYAKTGERGKAVIVGYLNRNQIAEAGEFRAFSEDANEAVATFIYLKNDGTIEFAGTGDFLARFNELKTGFDQLKSDHNTHVHTGNIGGPTSPPTVLSTASIDAAKIDEFKTP